MTDLHDEFAKIESYFAEGRRLWASNAELVVSRRFFEMWELTQQPRPFQLGDETFELAGETFHRPDESGGTALFCWEPTEECAALWVDGATCEQKFLVMFEEGEARPQEQSVVFHEEDELTFGERLEIMYDVVAWVRQNQPSRDLFAITKRAYENVLRALGGRHDARALGVMRRLRMSSVRKLISKAVEDLPDDEVSNQLVLPLDGNYGGAVEPLVAPFDVEDPRPAMLRISSRTRWSTQRDLEFIQASCLVMVELKEVCIISFEGVEILEQSDASRSVVRVPCHELQMLQEGDRLLVFKRGLNGPVGALTIDLLENNAILGRFSWNDLPLGNLDGSELYAKPRRGPTEYIAGMFNMLVQGFHDKGRFESPALNAATGVEDCFCEDAGFADGDQQLDASQGRAWANAVHKMNPVVLVQGPPGTGKTYVLEKVIRELGRQKLRILVTAPSNTAVDNVCRRIFDLPVLRTGNDRDSLSRDVAERCWLRDIEAVQEFARKRQEQGCSVYAGTHVSILRDEVVQADIEKNGLFDVILFDEAGMARVEEFLLCARMGKRAVLFGDHQQLPPFPLPDEARLKLEEQTTATRAQWLMLGQSALQWLVEARQFPVFMLQSSYRCQNPRLMRFSSTLFYDARVRASAQAEYYQLSFGERQSRYPASTLRIYRTSLLPAKVREEKLVVEGHRPGLENPLEARLCVFAFAEFALRYPMREITIIAPYRRQVRLIRSMLTLPLVRQLTRQPDLPEEAWQAYVHERVSTVDSFQGNESDTVIITYVRSNPTGGIGFVDNAQRINVAHTRCRREMIIIGDLDYLRAQARGPIFERMARAVDRDGQILDITPSILKKIPTFSS